MNKKMLIVAIGILIGLTSGLLAYALVGVTVIDTTMFPIRIYLFQDSLSNPNPIKNATLGIYMFLSNQYVLYDVSTMNNDYGMLDTNAYLPAIYHETKMLFTSIYNVEPVDSTIYIDFNYSSSKSFNLSELTMLSIRDANVMCEKDISPKWFSSVKYKISIVIIDNKYYISITLSASPP